ncbi:translocation/assembly module TamB [Halomonas sp. McH1-25]|uniref:autotransporter assembly complex protein TamB n=1 Tax=unclassified Halomonas TaxID=2609666 RepID=UPI001EF48C67|nr:translocation/assembly module TamB [Halomonas sp. McH1-25]MCP1341735.1 translocation/assembly module TamB [Halomonas sp. FL8]MCP1361900.1 translocation/assembly module TamB [Halomonas sp. BBD45]
MASAFRHRSRILITVLLRLLLWFPLWLIGLVLFLLGLALSPWGTSWLVNQGEERGFFSVESVSGAFLDDLTLEGLELTAGPAFVRIGRLHLAWAEDCLLDGKLCLDALQLSDVDVDIQESDATTQGADPSESEGGGMPSIAVPFPIELRALELRDVDVRLADGTRFALQRFTSGARLSGDTFTLLPTRLSDGKLVLPVSSGQALALPEPMVADGESDATSETEPPIRPLTADAIDAAIGVASMPVQASPSEETQGERDETSLADREPISLPEITLPMAIRVPSLVAEDFVIDGPERYVVERLALSLEGEGHDMRLHNLAVTSSEADAELSASVSLQDAYPLNAELNAVVHRAPLAGETLSLTLDGSLADLSANLEAGGPLAATLQAQADLLAPTVPFELLLEADRAQWPLEGTYIDSAAVDVAIEAATGVSPGEDAASIVSPERVPYVVKDLTLRADGDLAGYRVALSGAVSGGELPEEISLAMTGEGDLERFAWTPLAVSADSGALISRGAVRWTPRLEVDASLNLDRFSLDALTDAVQGRLSGDAEVHFAMREEDEGWQLSVPQLDIEGTLQQRPLSLEAQLSGNSDMRWRIQRLQLRQGENRLTAQGSIAESMDLSGELNAPALGTLLPALGGSAQGRFTVGGTFEAPQLDLTLSGNDLRYAENRLDRLSLDAETAGLEDPRLDVALDVYGIEAGGQRIEHVDLDLDGRLSQHRLELAVDAAESMPLTSASLALTGGLDAQRTRYQGRLTSLAVDTEQADLRLDEAAEFSVALPEGRVTAEPFCLVRQQGGRLCSVERLQASAEQGNVVLALRDFPMDLVNAALPEAWSAEGESNGRIALGWSSGGRWSAQADLQSRLALSGEDAYGQPWSLPDSRLSLQLDATPARANVESTLSLAEAGELAVNAAITDPTGNAQLGGNITFNDIQLSPYRRLVTGLEQLEGALNGQVNLGGALADPRLNGNLQLGDLRVSGGDIPLAIRDGRLDIQLLGDNATLDGFVAADEGRLELQGQARWPVPGEWVAELGVEGTQSPLLVDMPEFGRLRVAPDLDIRATPELLRIRGDVQVPWARLSVSRSESPPSAVAPSSDEVIITREDEARAREAARQALEEATEGGDEAAAQALQEAGMRLDVAVDVSLGPDVQLEAYGLEAELQGDLQVRQATGPVQLFGEINLNDGRYQAFGQDLIIRRGQVLFSGPASQPRLQFEAIRNPEATEDDVIAGLRVTGPASQPNLSIFSEPAMDESRALSYLLRGRAPDDAGGDDGALTSALIGLSLSRTGGAVGQLGQVFGVEDLSLDTSGSGEESQVVVSGYLFDDLKVSYGVGIFSPIAQLTLRYKLLQNLYVEAVSGAAQAVDLIYTFSLGRSNASP